MSEEITMKSIEHPGWNCTWHPNPPNTIPFDFIQQLRNEIYKDVEVKEILCAIKWPEDYNYFTDYWRKDIETQYGFDVIWREY